MPLPVWEILHGGPIKMSQPKAPGYLIQVSLASAEDGAWGAIKFLSILFNLIY
jgi:hypothetical protein